MKIKGRYVGLIEINFSVDLSAGNATPQEFKENMSGMNEEIQKTLEPRFLENCEDIQSNLKVTQQYFDMYEVKN